MAGARSSSIGRATGNRARIDLASALLQMMGEADILIAVTDLDGKVLAWNRALSLLTGCRESDGLGRKLGEWLTEHGVRDLADIMRDVGDRREGLRCEVRLPGNGGVAAAAFNVMPIRDPEGRPSAIMAVGHDLTALRGLQSQVLHAEKLATVGQIAAGVAHEINNPLTSVQMCVEAVLRKGTLALQGRAPNLFEAHDLERLQKIQEGAERIRKFTRDLTTYARPSGREVEPVDLSEVVEHALSFCEPVLFAAKATLARELGAELPKIWAVRDHIMQVVTNLVSNAAQSLPQSGGTVAVKTFRASDSSLALAVSDNGEGIREQDRVHIFEPFFTTKPAGRGTGLGLPVVKNIVLAHGGQIDFQPNPDGGTTFTVSLPITMETVGSDTDVEVGSRTK
jgi:two-component system, NtrC family, sensor kinase